MPINRRDGILNRPDLARLRAVNAAYREKYGERWPDETKEMFKRSILPTTLRLTPV